MISRVAKKVSIEFGLDVDRPLAHKISGWEILHRHLKYETLINENKLDEIEKEIKKYPLLSFSTETSKGIKSMKDFLNVFFLPIWTHNGFDNRMISATWEEGVLQCEGNRFRTFIDGYRTALTYFPEMSFKNWYNMLHENRSKKGNTGSCLFYFRWCSGAGSYTIRVGNADEARASMIFNHIDFKKYL